MSTVLVTTPTGQIGARVVDRLLDAGVGVRAYVRDPARLAPSVRDRVDVRVGTVEDRDALTRALDGVDAAFFLVPPHLTASDYLTWERGVGEGYATAAAAARLPRAVLLSSLGAHRGDLGPISVLGEVEERFRAALANVAVLRPAYFFENALAALHTIAHDGAIYGTLPADLAFPQVATRDIGDAAARWLTDLAWTGRHSAAVHGARDLSMNELAEQAGEALGRPVRYVVVSGDAAAAGMAAAGLSPSVVAAYGTMYEGLARIRFEHPEPRTRETTTPTEFATWARDTLRPAVAALGAGREAAAALT